MWIGLTMTRAGFEEAQLDRFGSFSSIGLLEGYGIRARTWRSRGLGNGLGTRWAGRGGNGRGGHDQDGRVEG